MMSRKHVKRHFTLLCRLGVYLGLYFLASTLLDKPILPPFQSVFSEVPIFFSPEILDDIYATYLRWFVIFIFGVSSATFIGLIVSYYPTLARYLSFDVDFWRSLPATALVAFFFALLGDTPVSRVAPAIYITVFTTLYYILKASQEIDRQKMCHLKQLGASNFFIISKWYLFEMMPSIVIAARQSISLSFLVLISTELIVGSSGNQGLGNRLVDWFFYSDFEKVIIALIFLGLTGYIANLIVGSLFKLGLLKMTGRANI